MLEKFLGLPVGQAHRGKDPKRMLAPGMMARHYSPRTPLRLKHPGTRLPADVAGIYLRKPVQAAGKNIFWLSRRGTLPEIARNLYRVLRAADREGFREIRVEPLSNSAGSLATALRDRLRRAAARQ
jgi:L-threonylcarbamoyladenylate synthase